VKKSIELRQERKELLDKATAIQARVESENRNMTGSETTEFENLCRRVELMGTQIKVEEQNEENEKRSFLGLTPRVPRASQSFQVAEPLAEYAITDKGERIPLLGPGDSFRSAVQIKPEFENLSLGKMIRGQATGKWDNAEAERRALTESTGGAGGYLVNPILSAELIDLARNKSVVMRAGARVLPMTTSEVKLARVQTDPTAYAVAENSTITESTGTFGQFSLRAKKLAVLTSASIELIEDVQNLDQLVKNQIAEVLALKLDYNILRGDGAGENIQGLFAWQDGTPAIGVVEPGGNGAALADYGYPSQAVQKILEANGTPNAVIYAPRSWGELDRLVETTTGQPLRAPDSWNQLQKFVTNQIPINLTYGTASDATELYVGDWTKLIVGMRTDVTLEISREANDAFEKGKVYIRGYLRADSLPTVPAHFTLIEGIIATT
jgi:HK97 family phage major capsid protein